MIDSLETISFFISEFFSARARSTSALALFCRKSALTTALRTSGAELNELYRTEASVDVKKRILQAMFVGNQSDRLIELAKGEKDPELRKTAIRNLGLMKRTGTSEALVSIYGSDSSLDVRKTVVNALFLQNNGKALVDLARAEKNPEMKKEIVSKLSVMKSKEAMDYLMELLK